MSSAPTRNDVLAKIAAVFPDRSAETVLAILDRYGSESHEQEKHRVQLAVLKLCDEEDQPDLEQTVGYAKQDFRDILSWAEYPNASKRQAIKDTKTKEKPAARDRQQYLDWLNKEPGV